MATKRLSRLLTSFEGDSPDSMQYRLKELYKQLSIPQAAWMFGRLQLPIEEFYFELKLQSTDEIISHKTLLKGKKIKRILIEGLPGYGKTTLATKIAHDWAINEQYTRRFDFVFFLPIRELHEKTIIDAIVDLVHIAGYKKPNKIRGVIRKGKKNILLILDGLDEVPTSEREKILQILYRREMKEMTVFVTCRSGEFNLTHGEEKALFKGLPIETDFYDRRVTVLGICKENKAKFLTKFLHEAELTDRVIEYLDGMTEIAQEIFDSPLMLILLADMVVRGEPIGTVTSRTSFYKDVVNFMIRRSEDRKNTFLTPSFSVFDSKNSENSSFKLKLRQFGHLCFQQVWAGNQLEFRDDELIRNVHKLGLVVIVQKKKTNISSKQYYQVYHRTIMEFMTAYYIYEEFLNNNFAFSELIEQSLIKDVVYYGKTSMVTPFLIGLMKQYAAHYFILTSTKYINIFQEHQSTLWRMLIECECIDQVEHSIISNLPSNVHLNSAWSLDLAKFYSSDLLKRVITAGTQSGHIKRINIVLTHKMNLPTDIELPYVSIAILKMELVNKECIQMLQLIKCHSCNITAISRYNDIDFNEYFKILMSIPAKSYSFGGRNEYAIYLMEKEGEWQENVIIDKFVYNAAHIMAFNTEEEQRLSLIATCNLLEKCYIRELEVVSMDGIDVIQILQHCKKVKNLHLKCKKICSIPMDTLFLNKQWESVDLHNVEVISTETEDFYTCKNVLLMGQTECSFLSKISAISHLECSATSLFEVVNYSSWSSLNTITEIVLVIDPIIFVRKFWRSFTLFPNLRFLRIKEWLDIDKTLVQKESLPNILLLPINTLTIEFPFHFDHAVNFIDDLRITLENVTVTSLNILVIQILGKCPLTINNFIQKCINLLEYCSEKKMSLKTLELNLTRCKEDVFHLKHVTELNIKYSFRNNNSISLLITSN